MVFEEEWGNGRSPTRSVLQLHMEPASPLEVSELTASLGSIARQYQAFAQKQGAGRTGDGRLLVSSVSPGSIDINFIPEIAAAAQATLPIVLPAINQLELLTKFGGQIKTLLDWFKGDPESKLGSEVTVKDCDDAVNIAAPIANHGGNQRVLIVHGDIINPIINLTTEEARDVVEGARRTKALLQYPDADRRQRVSMIWTRMDREGAKTEGRASPDKAVISEIAPKPKPVFFTDEMSYLKAEMIGDEENPYQHVYFVDVEVMLVSDKITGYRIVGYHGKDLVAD